MGHWSYKMCYMRSTSSVMDRDKLIWESKLGRLSGGNQGGKVNRERWEMELVAVSSAHSFCQGFFGRPRFILRLRRTPNQRLHPQSLCPNRTLTPSHSRAGAGTSQSMPLKVPHPKGWGCSPGVRHPVLLDVSMLP